VVVYAVRGVMTRKVRLAKEAAAQEAYDPNAPVKKNDKAGQKERLIVVIVILAVSIWFLTLAPAYNLMKSGLFPFIMALVMAGGSAAVLRTEIRDFIKLKRIGDAVRVRGNNWSQYGTTVLFLALYGLSLVLFGFYFGNFIMLSLYFRFFQKLKWWTALAVGAIFIVVVYVLFAIVFKTILWPGCIPMIIPNYLGGATPRPFF